MNAVEETLKRLVVVIDSVAALLLAVITSLTFIAVMLRYVFALPFPGSFDVSRLLLGVSIFWGIAAAAYRNDHIQVDLLWQVLPERGRKALELFADVVFLIFAGALAWMLLGQVNSVRLSQQTTFELDIPIWPFHALAWLGIMFCVLVLAARIVRAILSYPSRTAADQ